MVAQVLRDSHQQYSAVLPQNISVPSHIFKINGTNISNSAIPILHLDRSYAKPTISVQTTFLSVPLRFGDQHSIGMISSFGISEFEIGLTEFGNQSRSLYRYHRDSYIGLTENSKVATFSATRYHQDSFRLHRVEIGRAHV